MMAYRLTTTNHAIIREIDKADTSRVHVIYPINTADDVYVTDAVKRNENIPESVETLYDLLKKFKPCAFGNIIDGSKIDSDSTIQTQQNIPEGVHDFNDLLKELSSIAFKSGLETGDISYSAREATLNPNVPYTKGMTVKDILRNSSYLMYKSNLVPYDIKTYKSDGYLESTANLEDILLRLRAGTFRRRRLFGQYIYRTTSSGDKTTGVMQYKVPLSDYDNLDIDDFEIIDTKLYISGTKYYDCTFVCNIKQGPSGGPSYAELKEYNHLPGFSVGTYDYRISHYVENNYFIFEVSSTNPIFVDSLSNDLKIKIDCY